MSLNIKRLAKNSPKMHENFWATKLKERMDEIEKEHPELHKHLKGGTVELNTHIVQDHPSLVDRLGSTLYIPPNKHELFDSKDGYIRNPEHLQDSYDTGSASTYDDEPDRHKYKRLVDEALVHSSKLPSKHKRFWLNYLEEKRNNPHLGIDDFIVKNYNEIKGINRVDQEVNYPQAIKPPDYGDIDAFAKHVQESRG